MSFVFSTSIRVDDTLFFLDFWTCPSTTSAIFALVGVIGMDPLGPPFELQFNDLSISLMSFTFVFFLENKELSHADLTFRVGGYSNLHVVGTALVDPRGTMESVNARVL